MKRISYLLIIFILIFSLFGCGANDGVKREIKGDTVTYYEMNDGTWELDRISYKYRLEISGRMNAAAKDTTFVYLSNIPEISFDRAWSAYGLSSNTDDYFDKEEAVCVVLK